MKKRKRKEKRENQLSSLDEMLTPLNKTPEIMPSGSRAYADAEAVVRIALLDEVSLSISSVIYSSTTASFSPPFPSSFLSFLQEYSQPPLSYLTARP